MIHPTAIVHPGAQLHESVQIGPYSVIDEHVNGHILPPVPRMA